MGILEVLWKVCSAVVNCCLKRSFLFHNAPHGFTEGRRTGMAALESNMAQQLDRISQDPIFQVFWDVRKAYESLEKEWCLELFRGYRMGLNLSWLLESYWKRQRIVSKKGKCLGTEFGTGRGVTQGDLASPIIFNIVMDVVVQ